MSVSYIVFAALLFSVGNILSVAFIVVAILWFFIYPIWEKRWYRKHFEKMVRENFRDVAGTPIEVELEAEAIITKDFTGESRLLTSAMVDINELPWLLLLKFPGAQSLVLPKDAMHDVDAGIVCCGHWHSV